MKQYWITGPVVVWLAFLAILGTYTLVHFAERDFGPLRSFDSNPLGYSVSEARAILEGFAGNGGYGTRVYLKQHFPLDLIFPFLYAPAIAALWLWLAQQQNRPAWVVPILAVVPLAGGVLDLIENHLLYDVVAAGLNQDGSAVREDIIPMASMITIVKYACVMVSLIAALLGLVLWIFRRLALRGTSHSPGGK